MSKLDELLEGAGKAFEEDESPISMSFYKRNGGKMLLVIVLLLIYIELRYDYEEAIRQLDKMKSELVDVRYRCVAEWGELTSKNRPESIRLRVAQSEVELENADEPPFELD